MKFDPRSVMIVLGKPNLWSISLMNSTARSDEIFLIGLTSIHLVNLSTATRMCVKPPGAVGSGHQEAPASERPQWRYGYQVVSKQATLFGEVLASWASFDE